MTFDELALDEDGAMRIREYRAATPGVFVFGDSPMQFFLANAGFRYRGKFTIPVLNDFYRQ